MSINKRSQSVGEEADKDNSKTSSLRNVDTEANGELSINNDATNIGVFGHAAAAGGAQYRVMGRWKTGFVFIQAEVGIGVLSLPYVLSVLGLIPGLIAIALIGLVGVWTGYVILLYWQKHRHCDNLIDALLQLGGKPLATIGYIGLILNLTLACGSSVLTMSVALNTMSNHGTCTVGFLGICTIVGFLSCIPRTMNFVGRISGPMIIGIIVPIFTVIISLAIAPPQNAPPIFDKQVQLWGNPTFAQGFSAILSICYSYGGRQGFLTVIAEMANPDRDYVPALYILQGFAVPMYLITGGAIYGLAGQYITSPALGSAPYIPAKVAYGILMASLLNTSLFYGHTGTKLMYVSVMRDILKTPNEMTRNTVRSWGIWIGLGFVFWVFAFVLCGSIPVFSSFIAVASALLVSWFSFGLPAVFWLNLNWKTQFRRSWKHATIAVLNWLLLISGIFLNVCGMWASISTLVNLFNDPDSGVPGPWTCADNSLF